MLPRESRSPKGINPPVQRFPVIMGPTAGGKTALAVATAHALRDRGLDAEVISADSVQIYRDLDIGSAKPTRDERAGVVHHMIDVADPRQRFTVKNWLDGAEDAIASLRARGGIPVVAGGTHLYIKALLDGLFEGPEPDADLRRTLRDRTPQSLREELERVDPAAAGRLHPADLRRTIRALEIHRLTGIPISEHQRQWDRGPREDAYRVCLHWDAPAINQRINQRVRAMMDTGLLDEVRSLLAQDALGEQAREALGYKQLAAHLHGLLPLEDAVERIKIETRRFAKNQRTWTRRLGFPPPVTPDSAEIQKIGSRTSTPASALIEGPSLLTPEGVQSAVEKILMGIFPSHSPPGPR